MKNIKWFLTHIIPRTYWSSYETIFPNNPDKKVKCLSIWRQWLNKSWDRTEVEIVNKICG